MVENRVWTYVRACELEVNRRGGRIVAYIAQSWGGVCENKWFHVTIEAFWKHPGLGI